MQVPAEMDMHKKYDLIIGIDPDVDKSGFAVLDTKKKEVRLGAYEFPIILSQLSTCERLIKANAKRLVVVVEASWMHTANWHLKRGESARQAAAKGYDVGRNHQVGKLIVELCQAWGIPVIGHAPLRKMWGGKDNKITHQELIQFCPVDRKTTNQEMRDAALLAWNVAGFPIKLHAGFITPEAAKARDKIERDAVKKVWEDIIKPPSKGNDMK